MNVLLATDAEATRSALTRVVHEMGWSVVEDAEDRIVAKEGWKATGTTWPVTVEALIAEQDGGASVALGGKVGGLGPIQSRHARSQVTRFADLLIEASEVGADAVHQNAHQAATPEIAAAIGRLKAGARDSLLTGLRETETVRVIIFGSGGQAIAGTDSRVFVLKPGFLAGASFGIETITWNYLQITGIQLHKGMKTGAVIIQAPGQAGVSTNYWRESDSDPFKAPNAIPVTGDWDVVRSGVGALQDLIEDAQGRTTAQAVAASTPSMAAEIKELAALHEAGALSPEEFAAAKAKLIGG